MVNDQTDQSRAPLNDEETRAREKDRKDGFRKELTTLVNRYSQENGSNTPDFLLAAYLVACLETYDVTVSAREKWYGRSSGFPPLDNVSCPSDNPPGSCL